jgi:ankyrin repeat protein
MNRSDEIFTSSDDHKTVKRRKQEWIAIFLYPTLQWLYVLNGAYLDYVEKDGFSPINYAAMEEHWDVVEFLCQSGANPYLVDATGDTALSYARDAGQDKVVQLIGMLRPPDQDKQGRR